jgi:hypothetical protein
VYGKLTQEFFLGENHMNQNEFLNLFEECSSGYNWEYVGNRLVGTRGGRTFNPVTAVAFICNLGYHPPTKRGTLRAARLLGISQALATAVHSTSNRGHAQIVRGKMLNIFDWETV